MTTDQLLAYWHEFNNKWNVTPDTNLGNNSGQPCETMDEYQFAMFLKDKSDYS